MIGIEMLDIKGADLDALPFSGLKKVGDIIYFDGPILSHFVSDSGANILFYWADCDKTGNRWLVLEVSESQLNSYLSKEISLQDVIKSPLNDIYYTVDFIGQQIEHKNIKLIDKQDLNAEYVPDAGSYL